MRNEVYGKVIAVPAAKTGVGQRGPWRRQTVVIEYEDGRYSNKLALECSSSKAEDFGRLRVGQMVTIQYDVTSREFNGNYYTTANAFEWKVAGAQQSAPGGNEPF